MTYTQASPHIEKQEVTVTVDRDGNLAHFIDTFDAFLLASGFSLEEIDGDDEESTATIQ
jgi:hypothetical protein